MLKNSAFHTILSLRGSLENEDALFKNIPALMALAETDATHIIRVAKSDMGALPSKSRILATCRDGTCIVLLSLPPKFSYDLPKAEQYSDYYETLDPAPFDAVRNAPTDKRQQGDPVKKKLDRTDQDNFFERGLHQTVDTSQSDRPLTPFGGHKLSFEEPRRYDPDAEMPEGGWTFQEIKDSEYFDKLIDKYRSFNVEDFEWWDSVVHEEEISLEELGLKEAEIAFSGFASQGDGASFTCSTSRMEDVISKLGWSETYPTILEAIAKGAYGSVWMKRVNRHYVHENTVESYVELEDVGSLQDIIEEGGEDFEQFSRKIDEELNEFEASLEQWRETKSREIYRKLEKEYEYLTSDEIVAESLEANGYTFDDRLHIAAQVSPQLQKTAFEEPNDVSPHFEKLNNIVTFNNRYPNKTTRVMGNNTWLKKFFSENDPTLNAFDYVFHQTAVVRYSHAGIEISTGGWYSTTTSDRINKGLDLVDIPGAVYRRGGSYYYVYQRDWDHPYQFDNYIELDHWGHPMSSEGRQDLTVNRRRRQRTVPDAVTPQLQFEQEASHESGNIQKVGVQEEPNSEIPQQTHPQAEEPSQEALISGVVYPSVEDLLELNAAAIRHSGEGGVPGLRGHDGEIQLEAAIGRMQSGMVDREFYPSIVEKAAVLGHSIASEQIFIDGNKRTAFLAMDAFLYFNGYELDTLPHDVADAILAIASDTGSYQDLLDALHRTTAQNSQQ